MPPVGVKVSLNTEMQKFLQEKTVTPSPGQYPRMTADSAQVSAAPVTWTNAEPDTLMEQVLAPANLRRAYQRVVSNKGAPGADGMTVDDLADYVKQYWPTLKVRLLAGEYHPQGVRAVDIPKPKGGTRQLGIPSVVDRLIQQALLQQLTPIFDPLFSDYSYGFRPGRSAHQAIETARGHVAAGHRWCVELDLEKFFDRVNHDVLMAYVGASNRRQMCAHADPSLPRSGNDVGRTRQPTAGRDAARRPALAVAVEHLAQRTRPRTGKARPSLRALCRRREHLCAQSASWHAGDGRC